MTESKTAKPASRFGWLKWPIGLLLIPVMSATLLTYNLYQLTEEKPAIDLLTTATAMAFSPQGLDAPLNVDINQLNEATAFFNQSLPGLNLAINLSDIESKSPREARQTIFGKIATFLYNQPADRLFTVPDIASLIPPDGEEGIAQPQSEGERTFSHPIPFLTSDGHKKLGARLPYLITASVVLSLLLVMLSHGFRRLGNLGLVILLATIPGLLIFTVGISLLITFSFATEEINKRVQEVANAILPSLQMVIVPTYKVTLIVGIGLIAFAIIGSMLWKLTHKSPAPEPKSA